jgi:4-aminobutyrate aminotransferase-like enzyme
MPAADQLPGLVTDVPGPRSRELAGRLARHECRDTTFLSDDFPVFWERAHGCSVWDVDGNRYVDLTAAFGVCTLGHAHPEIVRALQQQSAQLVHGMGDVHPSEVKVRVAEELARLVPGDLDVCLFGSSGSDAIEAAMKTCAVATRRPGALAFAGAYHGLGYGALSLTWRHHFRAPFRAQLNAHVTHLAYPGHPESGDDDGAASAASALQRVDSLLAGPAGDDIGAVFVEPILGRGGVIVPHATFLPGLREICTRRGRLLVVDEIFTGLGRTGRWFACQHADVQPDLLCVGKSLAGGMPLSACVGNDTLMRSWERSRGEARHTATFFAHPMACAAALVQLDLLQRDDWPQRVARLGAELAERLAPLARMPGVAAVRGMGLLWGIALRARDGLADASRAGRVVTAALRRGWILLPAGSAGNVVELAPPFVIGEAPRRAAVDALGALLAEISPSERGSEAADNTSAGPAPRRAAH